MSKSLRSRVGRRLLGLFAVAAAAHAALSPAPVVAADWPAYRRDADRSARTDERLTFPLPAGWIWRSPQRPAPAWPEPGRALNAMDFDYAFQPVVAGGVVYFGSSADDSVRAVDAATGRPLWTFVAGAPVRFAPHVVGGKCYFASDDGHAYCLDARTGTEVWKARLGVDDRKLVATGRIASRWPCRSGVLVAGDVVYVTAGMWPSEGVYVFALDAASGRERWCNDTSCYDYLAYPHAPSAAFGGPAPQGYLLNANGMLLVPTGRCAPAAFDAATGRLAHWTADPGNRGGTHVTVSGGTMFVSTVAWQPDQTYRLGESPAHRADSLAAFTVRTGKEEWAYSKSIRNLLVDDPKAARWRSEVGVGVWGRQRVVFDAAGKRLFAVGNGKVDAIDLEGRDGAKRAWTADFPKAYAEVLCGNALVLGGQDEVVAFDVATGKELWRAAVEGQARGLAVSDGRLVVSTDRGVVHVFGADVRPPAAQPIAMSGPHRAVAGDAAAVLAALGDPAAAAETAGFAVLVGEPDARLAEALAARSRFHVACVFADPKVARAERDRLVATTGLHGSRISVHTTIPGPDGKPVLPFVPYLANLVVASGDSAGVSGAELYRVTRPCGGVLTALRGGDKLVAASGAPAAELKAGPKVVRGKLPGAFDWDSPQEADERVRWPLEFQWYGEPGPMLVMARHRRPRTPVAANGRLFVFGESHMTAVDSYNGAVLWRRRLSTAVCGGDGGVFADDTGVYISGRDGVARLDAATGRLTRYYAGGATAGPAVHDGTRPLHVEAEGRRVDAAGSIDVDGSGDALRLTLTTRNATASRNDAWELALDLRKPADRTAAPGPGTFELVVNAHAGTLRPFKTFDHPAVKVEKLPAAAAGESKVLVTIPWAEVEKQVGWRPTSFAIAADLKLWTEDFRERLWARPMTAGKGWSLDESQAVVALTPEAFATARQSAATPAAERVLSPLLPVAVADPATMPSAAKAPGRLPPLTRSRTQPGDGDYHSDRATGLAKKADAADAEAEDGPVGKQFLRRIKGFELPGREQPVTGEAVDRTYTRSYGCSGTSSSAVMDFFRSGTIGMYDRLDDSGMRNVSGIRSGCGLSLVPAHGLLLYSESAADCLCAYSFNASLGMAPAAGPRRNEDWALFDDVDLTSGIVRKAAINLGAAGDRRADDGTLWLAYPRPAAALSHNTTMQLPYAVDTLPGTSGAVRTNADRRPVAGTDRPWVYGSQIRGVSRVNVDLLYHEPRKSVLSAGAQPPAIDGKLDDPCWDGFAPLPTVKKDATYYVRHDEKNLYVAYEQKPTRTTAGAAEPWKAKVTGNDGAYDKDDHARIALRSAGGQRVLAFAVTAAGGKYDGRLDVATDVPAAAAVTVDGRADDWQDAGKPRGAEVRLPGGATVRTTWTPAGLAALVTLPPGYEGGGTGTTGLSLILGRKGGDGTLQQLSVDAKTPLARADAWQADKAVKPAAQVARAAAADGTVTVEALFAWNGLGGAPKAGDVVGLFARAYDPSEPYFKGATPVPWSTARSRVELGRPDRMIALRLADAGRAAPATPAVVTTEAKRSHIGYSVVDVVPVAREDAGWNGEWAAKVTKSVDAFRAELAIPWATLEAGGLTRANLLVDVSDPPKAAGAQDLVLRALDKAAVQLQTLPPSPGGARYTVRVHFAELDDSVAPGQRVFDVLLQGKPVLTGFDVAREAGGARRAVTRQFAVTADRQLELRFVPKTGAAADDRTAPILNGLEVVRE